MCKSLISSFLVLSITVAIFVSGCTIPEIPCPEGEVEELSLDSFRVAFEDLKWVNWNGGDCQGLNDYDYDDCVCDVKVLGKFICSKYLQEIKLEITYQNDGYGDLDHEFGLVLPSIFKGKNCTYNLNGSFSSKVRCPSEFVFFHSDSAMIGEVFYLEITFKFPFVYNYKSFVEEDIHGKLVDIKPYIRTYLHSDNSFIGTILAGSEDKRVLLVPDDWQWSTGAPLWDCYTEVIENNCYPEFINPGIWTWIGEAL